MTPREERKARNVYNESLRRAQAGDPSSYVQGEMQRYGISDPSAASFRGSGSGNLNQSIDTGKNYIGGLWGGAQRGLDALTQGVAMANENERWFKQNAPNAKRYAGVPMNVRESVQTGRDKSFYDKYTKLARLAQDSDKKQWYLDQADTARRNLQITKRINYGLGQMDLDETPFKGYESYDPGFEGFGPQDLGPRFDIDKFTEAMSEYLPGGEEITETIAEEDVPVDLSYTPETVWGPEGDPSIIMAGMEPYPDWEPYKDEWYDLQEDIGGVEEDLTENIEETTETFTDLGDTHAFTKEFSWGAGDYEDVQEYVTALIGDPDSTWYKMDQDELVKILIKQNRIKEK
jgi:hypothetical protein